MSQAVRRKRRVGWVLGVVALLLAVGAAAAAATGFGFGPRDGEPPKSSGLPPATSKVTRQTLVDGQTEDGRLGYGDTTSVSGRLAGTVTALPAAGTTIQRGQPLYHVDNAPVVLLYGGLPAYRALAPGTEGADVRQFEQNLAALGYRGFTVDDTYSETTATAVKRWQDDLGLPETGIVDLGRIGYAAGPVRVDTHQAAVGDDLRPGTALYTYTGTSRVVTVELDMSDQRLARQDAAVRVTLPDGKTTTGKIARVQTVISPAEGQQPAETKIKVTVTLDDENVLAGLDQATLGVAFTATQRENVLTIPVAALLALSEGGYGVQLVDGATTRIIPVRTGLFAGGRVEVSGDGLTEGAIVGMPS
jgi:peptidoglycan hydrolase-like protein with peptidoglycan-binding domain